MTDNTPEQHAPDVSQALSVLSEAAMELPLPFLKILNGYPEDDKMRTVLDARNEPSEEVLREFFTPEVIQRLAYCPQINRDETDDWGMFGYEPGYIFVCGTAYEGARSFNDQAVLMGKRGDDKIKTASGVEIYVIPHYDFFPRHKFINQKVTAERTPKTFAFLRHLLENVDPNDVSTYQTDDLRHELQLVERRLNTPQFLLEEATEYRQHAKDESLRPGQQRELLIAADKMTQELQEAQEKMPENIKRYLSLIMELQGRKEIENPSAPQLPSAHGNEDMAMKVQMGLQKAILRGDDKLVNELEDLIEMTDFYRDYPQTKEQLFITLHDKAMDAEELNKIALRNKDFAGVQRHLLVAYRYEEAVANLLRNEYDFEPIRGSSHRDAAILAMRVGRLEDGERLAREGLKGKNVPPKLLEELEEVLVDIKFKRENK